MTEQQKLNRETELKIAQSQVNDAIFAQMIASQQPTRDNYETVIRISNLPTGTYLHL